MSANEVTIDSESGRAPDVQARILRAASECFERFGLRRTRVDDIARYAGVSRQTVYNHFRDKAELAGEYLSVVARNTNARARARVDVELDSLELMVQAQLAMMAEGRIERANSTLVHEGREIVVAVVDNSQRLAEAQRAYWSPIFDIVQARGHLRNDLDFEDAVDWLTFTLLLLHMRPSTFGGTEEEVGGVLTGVLVPCPPGVG